MANDYLTLSDLLVFNSRDLDDIYVSDLLQETPFLNALYSKPATNGNLHKYQKTTGAPVVGFRAENDGREYDSTVRTGVTVTLKIGDASFDIDKAIADAYIGGSDACVRMEMQEHLKAMFFKLEQQILGGTVEGDSAGFAGLADETTLDDSDDSMVVDAGGSTALTSVWAVRMGDADTAFVAGNGGNVEVGELQTIQKAGATTGWYPAYWLPVTGWYGLQVGSVYSAGRICNIDAGSNTMTDDLAYNLLKLFPANRRPNAFIMNRRSQEQLRQSRTATNATGAPAPLPETVCGGIPVYVTDAIGNAETALTAA